MSGKKSKEVSAAPDNNPVGTLEQFCRALAAHAVICNDPHQQLVNNPAPLRQRMETLARLIYEFARNDPGTTP
jgi:hypothetical protein